MDKKKPGPKSAFDESLGTGVHGKNPRYPVPIWDLLKEKETKKLLNKMALDENIKQKAWELGQ
jgi:hypothetical protein